MRSSVFAIGIANGFVTVGVFQGCSGENFNLDSYRNQVDQGSQQDDNQNDPSDEEPMPMVNDDGSQTFDDPAIEFNGQLHYVHISSFNDPAFASERATAFCKAKLGENATLVNYAPGTMAQATPYYSYHSSGNSCSTNQLCHPEAVNGFCVCYLETLNFVRYAQITCLP